MVARQNRSCHSEAEVRRPGNGAEVTMPIPEKPLTMGDGNINRHPNRQEAGSGGARAARACAENSGEGTGRAVRVTGAVVRVKSHRQYGAIETWSKDTTKWLMLVKTQHKQVT